jgi:hypothetical protein
MARIVLTALEIEAVLGVAGDALAEETLKDVSSSEAERRRLLDAFESGMEKLRSMLARREEAARTRRQR